MTFRRYDRISIFGALQPGASQTVTRAVVSTYSLDLVAMLGLVLALGGDPEVEFAASPLGLVRAFERVRGRLLVLHQLGRILAPRAHRSVLPLLDTMVRAIPSNERQQSWHPKIALVRYEGAAGVEWRFWIGSRNLTGSTDLDAGLLLVTSTEKGAKILPDIARLAEDLLREAGLNSEERSELRSARWLAPAGVSVRSILWRRPGETASFLTSKMLSRADRGCAVSPFINRGGVEEALGAGAAAITLLTTREAGSACAPVGGVAFRYGASPEPAALVSVEEQEGEVEGDFIEPPLSGIHAKLLAVTRGDRTALMLGSANLTSRGLIGPNAEAVALLDLTDQSLANSLYEFVENSLELDATEPDSVQVEKERAARELDALVSQFLEKRLTLKYDQSGLVLILGDGPDVALAYARFEVAPFLKSDAWIRIEQGQRSIRLLTYMPTLSEQTMLVEFRARSEADPDVSRSWVQALEVEGLDEERRDRALLARYVGASRFREWLRSLLDGIDGTGGERWFEMGSRTGRSDPVGQFPQLFTLETMLAAWARDYKAFESRVAGMAAMLESFQETFESIPDEDEREAALRQVAEVRPFLRAVDDAIRHGQR